MGKNLNMHMLQLHMVNIALVEICPRRKKDSLNVEYHVTVLLMNIAVATTIKQVGFGLEMDLRVSFNIWFLIFIQKMVLEEFTELSSVSLVGLTSQM